MEKQIQFYHKISETFNVSPAELIALIPEHDRRELIAIAAEIEKHEAKVEPYVKTIEKGNRLAWDEGHYLHGVAALIRALRAEASLYLEPVYKERRKRQAELENDRFINEYRNTIEKFREELNKVQRPNFFYPSGLTAFQPGLWYTPNLPTQQQVKILAGKLFLKMVPNMLKNLVSWEPIWEMRTMPIAKYRVLGVPCLIWYLKIIILIEVRLKWKEIEFTKEFQGYEYSYKQDAGDLGSLYVNPVKWGMQKGFTTPTVLLSALSKGELESNDLRVVEHNSPFTTFAVKGFEGGENEFIELHDDFCRFITHAGKDKPLSHALFTGGVIDDITSRLVSNKFASLKLKTTSTENPKIIPNSDYEQVINALTNLGYPKNSAEEAAECVMRKFFSETLQVKITEALKYLDDNK